MFARHAPEGWTAGARHAMEGARETLGEFGDRARHGWDEMEGAAAPYRRTLEDAVAAHPVKAVAASLAVGVLLGWLVKRS